MGGLGPAVGNPRGAGPLYSQGYQLPGPWPVPPLTKVLKRARDAGARSVHSTHRIHRSRSTRPKHHEAQKAPPRAHARSCSQPMWVHASMSSCMDELTHRRSTTAAWSAHRAAAAAGQPPPRPRSRCRCRPRCRPRCLRGERRQEQEQERGRGPRCMGEEALGIGGSVRTLLPAGGWKLGTGDWKLLRAGNWVA